MAPTSSARSTCHAYRLELPRQWLSEYRLSAAALADESLIWRQTGATLQIIRRAG